jgi:hypothetical protein
MKYFALLGALLMLVACGAKDDHGNFAVFPTGGSGGKATTSHAGASGTGGSSGAAEGGEAGAVDVTAPVVSITSPAAVSDPDKGMLVTGDTVLVLCDASAAKTTGATIDAQTVKIEAFDAKGVSIGTAATASTQNAMDANEYGATFSLVNQPNGAVSFTCSASDKSTPPVISTATINTFLDNGPTITPLSPLPLSSFSLKSKVLFKFTVTPSPLTSSDKLAAVDMTAGKVTLTVDNVVIDLTSAQSADDPTTYSVNVDLNDPVQFPKTPAGTVPVQITAWDTRGIEGKYPYTFDIDGTPPTIKIVSPSTGMVVGGHVTLEFTVSDAQSGVDTSTVSVTLNNQAPVLYDPTPNSGWEMNASTGTFDYGFDSNESSLKSQVQVHVVVQASDKATNAAEGATEDLYIDNQPPVVDLDPPPLQERRLVSTGVYNCSEPFDPLGVSPNDLAIVPSAGTYRSLVWDETNSVDGETVLHYAGADQTSVFLYAQADPATPLLVAKHNTQNYCDDLATDAASSLALEHLSPIAPQGASYYDSAAPVTAGVCTAGTDSSRPAYLCSTFSDLTRVIDHAVVGMTEPVIYAIAGSSIAECTGQNWSLVDAGLPNGWICLASLARDKVGNLGISPPLRVCLNSTLSGKVTPACAISSTIPPTCTDGCIPPPHFNDTIIDLPH